MIWIFQNVIPRHMNLFRVEILLRCHLIPLRLISTQWVTSGQLMSREWSVASDRRAVYLSPQHVAIVRVSDLDTFSGANRFR